MFEFRNELWHQKTRVKGLSCGVICVILRLAVLIQYRSVTDTHTHTHTHRHTTTAYTALSKASRGKNDLEGHSMSSETELLDIAIYHFSLPICCHHFPNDLPILHGKNRKNHEKVISLGMTLTCRLCNGG